MFLQCNFVSHQWTRPRKPRQTDYYSEAIPWVSDKPTWGTNLMKTIARRLAIVLSATAMTVGLLGVAAPAEAKGASTSMRDTSWPV